MLDEKSYGVQLHRTLRRTGFDPNIAQNLSHGLNANLIRFETGTVAPAGSNFAAEHMVSFNFAYKLASAKDWMFE